MRFQKRIRMQVIVGLGAALLTAGAARAQQDMDPTYFDVNPGTPAATQVATASSTPGALTANVSEQDASAPVLAGSSDATLDASVTRIAFVDAGVAVILLSSVISMALYAMVATRRERSSRKAPGRTRYAPVSAATAQ
ncbi:MAG TPA: hypothetical protein VKQ28_02495 [Candidatus Acidoferrum sp.]|nr:hypothetical protein [Candidatus Acidoferrum sp.]